ncbi:MAG: hypothetical protein WAS24_01245 [Thermoplasmata archaeon]
MVNWEFWGNKNAWIAMGIGGLMVIVGILFILSDIALGFWIIVPGIMIIIIVGYYLVYWENWLLLKRKKEV